MNRDTIIKWANDILYEVRSDAEYRRLSALADNYDEEAMIALSDLFHKRLDEEINRLPRHCQEEVQAVINQRLARSSGGI